MTEAEIRARLERKTERLGKLRTARARLDAGTLEAFEALDDMGREAVFDADPDLFRRHLEAVRDRGMTTLTGGPDDERD